MKCTPQKTIHGASGRARPLDETGIGGGGQVARALHAPLGVQVGALAQDEQGQLGA
jgi:hypothetical protein